MNGVTHAEEVARQDGVMKHHLEDGIHVASLAQVEEAADPLSATRPL